jgi:hypothetical protein
VIYDTKVSPKNDYNFDHNSPQLVNFFLGDSQKRKKNAPIRRRLKQPTSNFPINTWHSTLIAVVCSSGGKKKASPL